MILWKRGVRHRNRTMHSKEICVALKQMGIISMYAQDHTAEVYNYRVEMNGMRTDFRSIWPHLPAEIKQKALHEAERLCEDRMAKAQS